jgi:hypothetical protein
LCHKVAGNVQGLAMAWWLRFVTPEQELKLVKVVDE